MAAGIGDGQAATLVRELWRHPNPPSTAMFKFMLHVNAKYNLDLDGYPSLLRWSIDNVSEFWEEVWHFVGIRSSRAFDQVGDQKKWSFLSRPSSPLGKYKGGKQKKNDGTRRSHIAS